MANVLITGANRGIGLALTRAFLAHGDTVIATQRATKPDGELAKLKKQGAQVDIVTLDVTNEASLAKAAAALKTSPSTSWSTMRRC